MRSIMGRARAGYDGDVSCRIDCYSYMARFGTKHAGQAISRAYGKSNSLFLVKFCYILPACLTKKSVIYVQNSSHERSNYTHAVIINKTNFRTQSTKSI